MYYIRGIYHCGDLTKYTHVSWNTDFFYGHKVFNLLSRDGSENIITEFDFNIWSFLLESSDGSFSKFCGFYELWRLSNEVEFCGRTGEIRDSCKQKSEYCFMDYKTSFHVIDDTTSLLLDCLGKDTRGIFNFLFLFYSHINFSSIRFKNGRFQAYRILDEGFEEEFVGNKDELILIDLELKCSEREFKRKLLKYSMVYGSKNLKFDYSLAG